MATTRRVRASKEKKKAPRSAIAMKPRLPSSTRRVLGDQLSWRETDLCISCRRASVCPVHTDQPRRLLAAHVTPGPREPSSGRCGHAAVRHVIMYGLGDRRRSFSGFLKMMFLSPQKLQERQLAVASTRRGAILVWEAGVAARLPGATLLSLFWSPSV